MSFYHLVVAARTTGLVLAAASAARAAGLVLAAASVARAARLLVLTSTLAALRAVATRLHLARAALRAVAARAAAATDSILRDNHGHGVRRHLYIRA